MNRKQVKLKTGKTITLYFTESTGLWTAKKPNMHRLVEGQVSTTKASRIIRFWQESTGHTRSKIESMVNESLDNIPIVYDMILTIIHNRKRKA